jgi:hypothetical protein
MPRYLAAFPAAESRPARHSGDQPEDKLQVRGLASDVARAAKVFQLFSRGFDANNPRNGDLSKARCWTAARLRR